MAKLTVSAMVYENCDKCGVAASEADPIFNIQAGTRRDRNVIFVHERCLIKAIDKAKKEYAKEAVGADSIYSVFCVYDSMEGRALAAEHRLAEMKTD